MSDQDNPNRGNLVPAGSNDLTPLAATNPLVSRGIADLANIQELQDVSGLTRHPFDVSTSASFKAYQKFLKALLRVREALRQKGPEQPDTEL